MPHADFVHLRVHTAYSLSEGAMHIKNVMKQAQGHSMPAVAMTDTNNMFGALEFSSYLKEGGVQPIVGVSLAVRNPYIEPSRSGKKPHPDWLILLAQNADGYANLMKLVSKAHLETEGETPQIDIAAFKGQTDGLICLSGGAKGPLGRLILDGSADKAELILEGLKALFPNRLYVEISRHDEPDEDATEETMVAMAYRHDLPLVATNEAFFASASMYEAHDALLCIADKTYVSSTERRRLNANYRFKSAGEMRELFKDLPEACDNTLVIARRCAYRVKGIKPLLPNYTKGQDVSEADMMREWSKSGLRQRLDILKVDDEKPYWDRLDFEMNIIEKMGFPGYFLIVADFIQWAKDNGIPVGPGRGSGAGSLVAYALKITDLDPLRFSLLFERFLNPERVSMPDFDIDFCQDRRGEVIRYVQRKYGTDQVAQIITFGKLQARAVVNDVGRVMQMPFGQVGRITKMIPNDPGKPVTLQDAINGEPRLKAEIYSDPLAEAVIDRALKLEGLYRHSSTHAAGVVIGDRPLDQLVPLYRDPKSDMPVTQFDMKWVETAGLVKFDFLGLKTLTVLAKACEYLKKRGIEVDLSTVPLDDKRTFDLLAAGDAAGVFQLESQGMRAVLKGLKPDMFEDIIAVVALYRPGPMDNIPTYVKRKHGEEAPDYFHPLLEPLLKETYGVIIYQEQVMQIAQVLSGYSLGEADLLRRAMGKKKKEEMDKQRARFIEGAATNGVTADHASFIFDMVDKFAGYGFNKSHAAAYALVSYHTAYLKANYPVEFMAGLMSLDMHNTDKLADFKNELVRLGIPILGPDINRSEVEFAVEAVEKDGSMTLGIRYALAAIKNVGEGAMESVIAERNANGPYLDMFDFASRLDPKFVNKRAFEKLVAAGAFDSIEKNRNRIYQSIEFLLKEAQAASEARTSAQVSLFGGAAAPERPPLPELPDWAPMERLEQEQGAIGYYLSAHPLDQYTPVLLRNRVVESKDVLAGKYDNRMIKLGGAIQGFSQRKSKTSGKPFGTLTLSDKSGGYEVMCFSSTLDTVRTVVEGGGAVVVTVKVERREEDRLSMVLEGIASLESLAAQSEAGLNIFVSTPNAVDPLKTILDRAKGGKGRVSFIVSLDGGRKEATLDLPGGFKITPAVRGAVAATPGILDAVEV